VVEYNLIGNTNKFAILAEILGQNTDDLTLRESASLCVDALFNLNNDVGIPTTLYDLDIPFEAIPEMAEIALTVTRPVENNPRKATLEAVIKIYETAFNEDIPF
jgi:alcohol dehydrogenase